MEKKREIFCLLGTINGTVYTTAKLRTVYIASFSKKNDHYNLLNNIRVDNSCIKTRYFNYKSARNADKDFLKHEFSNCHPQAIRRLIEIPKSTKDVLVMVKRNLTEVPKPN